MSYSKPGSTPGRGKVHKLLFQFPQCQNKSIPMNLILPKTLIARTSLPASQTSRGTHFWVASFCLSLPCTHSLSAGLAVAAISKLLASPHRSSHTCVCQSHRLPPPLWQIKTAPPTPPSGSSTLVVSHSLGHSCPLLPRWPEARSLVHSTPGAGQTPCALKCSC